MPDFLIHTGDLTHTSKPRSSTPWTRSSRHERKVFYVPGEHDTSDDDGKLYLERYGKGTTGNGWYSFDHKGVHFVGLVNVVAAGRHGQSGRRSTGLAQAGCARRWAAARRSCSSRTSRCGRVYPEWGWGTADSEQALALLKRFGSLTVLNGHIHQVMQKVEGNVSFHTAMSTAFPQPAPGTAPSPGPMKVPAEKLQSVLGMTEVHFVPQKHQLAVVDSTLADAQPRLA